MKTMLYFTWDPPLGIPIGHLFTIRFYSLMYLFAFGCAYYLMKRIFLREKVSFELLDPLLIYSLVGMFIGMRLGEVFFYSWDYYHKHLLEIILPIRENPNVFLINLFGNHWVKGWEFTGFRGLASHGATIGFFIAFALFWKRFLKPLGKKFFWLYDRIVIPIALGGAFVRTGNFFNSEMVGFPASKNLPWAVQFIKMSVPRGKINDAIYNPMLYRHPAQMYEATGYILIFILLLYLYRKTEVKKYSGFLFGLFFILLWSVRFFVEFFKLAQVEDRANWVLNTGQWLSIPFIIAGIIILITSFRRVQKG